MRQPADSKPYGSKTHSSVRSRKPIGLNNTLTKIGGGVLIAIAKGDRIPSQIIENANDTNAEEIKPYLKRWGALTLN